MSANSPRIRMTIAVPNEIYQKFHSKTSRRGQAHNKALVRLMELYAFDRIDIEWDETQPPLRRKA